jgi:hypothetical protein
MTLRQPCVGPIDSDNRMSDRVQACDQRRGVSRVRNKQSTVVVRPNSNLEDMI